MPLLHTNLSQKPFILDSASFNDAKAAISERIIPWEGLARLGVVTEDDANNIKRLEKQSAESRKRTLVLLLDLYSHSLLNLLNKLQVDDKTDVVKNILCLINDLLVGLPDQELLLALLQLSSIDESLPYHPFVKHLDSADHTTKTLALYNLTLLFGKAARLPSAVLPEPLVLAHTFSVLLSDLFIGNTHDPNAQFIGVQLLQELVLVRAYKTIYYGENLTENFGPINNFLSKLAKRPNSSGLQLLYNVLLVAWILTFDPRLTKAVLHEFPDLVSSLLIIAKESVKLKVVRVAVGTLKNLVTILSSPAEQFKVIKLVLFYGGMATIATLKERKFASNGSDEELSKDLEVILETLNEIVATKMTSFEEYLTEMDNPHLIGWTSPMHKSAEFWQENARKFQDKNYSLVGKMFEIMLLEDDSNSTTRAVIMLNDLQFLIKELGAGLVEFISTAKDAQYKLLIMSYLDNTQGDSELKYQALKTVQLLVGHGA